MSDAGLPTPCRPWGAWASLGWGVAAIAAWLGVQIALSDVLIEWLDLHGEDAARLVANARFVALVTITAVVAPLAVIAVAVRFARCGLSEYLGLNRPDRRYVLIGVAVLAILIPLVDLVSYLAGRAITPKFVIDLYLSARDSGSLWLLVIALVVAAPVVEETVFRGFLLPGLAASRLGAWGAILLTAVAWALLHAQYQPFYLAQIVLLGAVFGWLRLRSGSTTLTMGLHGIVNLTSIVQAAATVEWFS